MCLITNKKPKVLKKDLIVYKILKSSYLSQVKDFKYIKDKLNITEFTFASKLEFWSAPDHIAIKMLDAINKSWSWPSHEDLKGNLICVSEGFHAYLTIKRAKDVIEHYAYSSLNFDVYKFMIPKGSTYYKDGSGCIVSNQIILIS